METSSTLDLSVVIPAYNEQARIAETLLRVKAYLKAQDLRSEVIVVDDGSRDLTLEVVKTVDIYGEVMHEQDTSRITTDVTNRGKGAAVRRGFELSRGRAVLFTDADLSTPIEEVEKMLPLIDSGADLVIGSRRLPDSEVEPQPPHRQAMGWLFAGLVRTLAVPGVRDSQCGFKCYRGDRARELAVEQRMNGFSFDVEHLFLAHRARWRIVEVPVRWVDSPGTTVKPLRDAWRMLRDLIRIRRLHRSSNLIPAEGRA